MNNDWRIARPCVKTATTVGVEAVHMVTPKKKINYHNVKLRQVKEELLESYICIIIHELPWNGLELIVNNIL